MDACEHHFLITLSGQGADLFQHLFRSAGAHPSSGVGDDAVAAKLVAAVLHLDKRPGPVRDPVHMQGFVLIGVGDVDHIGHVLPATAEKFIQNVRQACLLVISHYDIHRGVLFQRVGGHLHVAARCHHNGIRVHFLGPVQHLAGFAVRDIGHGAGVDNIYVRLLVKGDDLITAGFQLLLHGLGFVCIYLASKVVKSRLGHVKTSCFC